MVLVGIHEEMRPLGRHKHQGENNIKMHLKGYSVECLELICMAQDRDKRQALVNAITNPLYSIKYGQYVH
jgi:Tfp pilus assembly protein PilP